MTTIRQLITDGYREAGITEVGVSPNAEEHEEGLRQIHRILRSLFGNELGEQLRTVNFGASGMVNSYGINQDYSSDIIGNYIPTNVRLILNNDSAETLYLHPSPQDGSRVALVDRLGNLATYNIIINGNGRDIESGSSVTLNTNSLNREWFYRADLADWVRVTDPDADDESPFPMEFDDLLTTLLAFRLNPRYGAETSANLGETLRNIRSRFRARYRQTVEVPVEDGLLFLPSQFNYNIDFDFNRG